MASVRKLWSSNYVNQHGESYVQELQVAVLDESDHLEWFDVLWGLMCKVVLCLSF